MLTGIHAATDDHCAVDQLRIALLDHVGEDSSGLVTVVLLLLRLLEAPGELLDLLGLAVDALLSEPLLLSGLLHLHLGASSLSTQLEEIGAGAFGLCRINKRISK